MRRRPPSRHDHVLARDPQHRPGTSDRFERDPIREILPGERHGMAAQSLHVDAFHSADRDEGHIVTSDREPAGKVDRGIGATGHLVLVEPVEQDDEAAHGESDPGRARSGVSVRDGVHRRTASRPSSRRSAPGRRFMAGRDRRMTARMLRRTTGSRPDSGGSSSVQSRPVDAVRSRSEGRCPGWRRLAARRCAERGRLPARAPPSSDVLPGRRGTGARSASNSSRVSYVATAPSNSSSMPATRSDTTKAPQAAAS